VSAGRRRERGGQGLVGCAARQRVAQAIEDRWRGPRSLNRGAVPTRGRGLGQRRWRTRCVGAGRRRPGSMQKVA